MDLLSGNCYEGVSRVSHHLTDLLSKEDYPGILLEDLVAYYNLLVTLECHPVVKGIGEQMDTIRSVFDRLEPVLLFRLIVDLSQKKQFHDLAPLAVRQLHRNLQQSILNSNLDASGSDAYMAEVLLIFLNSDDSDSADDLVMKISETKNPAVLEKILASPAVWGQASDETLATFMLARIHSLTDLLDEPTSDLRSSLSSCFQLVLRLERNQPEPDDLREEALTELVEKLSVERLGRLILDVYQLDKSRLKKRTASLNLFTELCSQLVSSAGDDQKSLAVLTSAELWELFKIFVWLGDPSLVRRLVKMFCKEDSAWNPVDKIK